MNFQWQHINTLDSKSYKCGYCGNPVASEKGFFARSAEGYYMFIYVCHHCYKPTFFDRYENQTPGIAFGEDVKNISDTKINELYNEARKCFSTNSFTAVVLSCRKILMHIAVEKGAPEGQNFIDYVEYLSTANYIPPGAKGWVDHIRTKGNEANHEIVLMQEEDARDLLSFIQMLLKIIYEFPASVKIPE